MRRRLMVVVAALLFALALLLWWRGVDGAIATLRSAEGDVSRDTVSSLGTWVSTALGDVFFPGDGVRTGEGSEAELEVGHGARIRTRPRSIFRVYLGEMPEAELGVDLEIGAAAIATSGDGLSFESEIGLARLSPSSRLVVERAEEGGVFTARLEEGQASVRLGDGREMALEEGRVLAATGFIEEQGEEATLDVETSAEVEPEVAPLNEVAQVVVDGEPARFERGGGSVVLEVGTARLLTSPGWLSVEVGHAVIETGDEDLPIQVPGARLVARAGGTRASADVADNALDLEVFEGEMEVYPDRGGEELLGAGERLHLEDGSVTVQGRGPSVLDLVLPPGGTAKILDPRPPTHVGFSLPARCEGSGWVERVERDRRIDWDAGVDQVSLALDAGRHLLRFRCLVDGEPGAVVARARVTVERNDGRDQLPPAPPITEVDLDGRTYRVHYQNRLPEIRVSWPRAAGSPPFTLEVRRGSREQTLTSTAPRFTLPRRRLSEGSYRLVARDASGRGSRPTQLEIEFDNAATGASLASPLDGSFGREEAVSVQGTAVQGARVQIEGGSASADAAGRFSGRAWVPAGRRGFAVRLGMPGHAPQYFIRRVRESSP